jgi:hypothetical protein
MGRGGVLGEEMGRKTWVDAGGPISSEAGPQRKVQVICVDLAWSAQVHRVCGYRELVKWHWPPKPAGQWRVAKP